MTGTDLVMPVLGGQQVLVVESDEDSAAALTAALRLHGFTAQSARNGKEALKLMAATRPCMIVLDLHLPDMDGCELIKKIRTRPDSPVVVVVTGETALGWQRAATAAGAAAYLLKPADPQELVRLIRKLCEVPHRAKNA